MSQEIVRKVIVDAPTNKDLFRGKGHERTALSLANAIRNFDNDDRAIGLDGPWGSGKSSVVEIAARHLASTTDQKMVHHHFFTFDIWKSQGTGFRRSFLEHFVGWATVDFPSKRAHLQEIEEDIRGKRREISTSNQPVLGWFGIVVLFLLPLLPIYYFWTKSVFDELSANTESTSPDFITSPPGIVFGLFALSVLVATFKKMWDHAWKLEFKTALSSILLISSKQHQDHKAIQKIREIDPNDYEFHTTLRKILGTVQTDNRKVVVVLDNIDRLPQKEIMDYWALVRSIFSGTQQSAKIARNETITAIVPYDRAHIEDSVNKQDIVNSDANTHNLTHLSSRELFSKTFDEILVVAPPVLSNAREFFSEKLEEALPKHVSKDHGFRTYRIFTELVRADGGLTTPRQVVSFVNDVSGLFTLHEGQFPLPTIAAYLAHQNLISNNPSVLNDYANLDRKVVDLASDPNLAKNLAAIVFNVAPDLAFEVLLDNQLASAILADNHEELALLSNSPGFDLRIDDVIASNSEEWVSTSDFGAAISNFVNIMPSYRGAAKPRILAALIKAFNGVEAISVSDGDYSPFLSMFDIVNEDDRPALLRQFLKKAFEGISKLDVIDFDTGRSFAAFLGESRTQLEALNLAEEFKDELSKCAPDSNADFLYGLALDITANGLSFSDLGTIEISLPKEGSYYVEIATQDPASALPALKQFSLKSILNEEDWIQSSKACIQQCFDKERPQKEIAELLDLTCFARSRVSKGTREEISLAAALADGQFFRNLGIGDSKESEKSIALTLFILGQNDLGKQIAVPTKLHQNGQRLQDASNEYTQFNEIMIGNSELSDFQAALIAEKATGANSMVDVWTKFGNVNRGHTAVQMVVKSGYLSEDIPNISLDGLNLYYEYLTDLLGPEDFKEVLQRFSPRLNASSVSNTKLDKVSIGFVSATHLVGGENWNIYHDQIENLLRSISSEDWKGHIAAFDKISELLVEKISTSGCELESAKFREPLVNTMLDILAGEHMSPAPDGAFDTMLLAIDGSYRDDILRTLREKIADVSPTSLESVVKLFPLTLSKAISEGERVTAHEKDNIIRHLLCPALEGNNKFVLEKFVALGNRRIKDFKNHSIESTIRLLDGTLDSFSKRSVDRYWTQQVLETVQGKRRARSILDVLWGINNDDE